MNVYIRCHPWTLLFVALQQGIMHIRLVKHAAEVSFHLQIWIIHDQPNHKQQNRRVLCSKITKQLASAIKAFFDDKDGEYPDVGIPL